MEVFLGTLIRMTVKRRLSRMTVKRRFRSDLLLTLTLLTLILITLHTDKDTLSSYRQRQSTYPYTQRGIPCRKGRETPERRQSPESRESGIKEALTAETGQGERAETAETRARVGAGGAAAAIATASVVAAAAVPAVAVAATKTKITIKQKTVTAVINKTRES